MRRMMFNRDGTMVVMDLGISILTKILAGMIYIREIHLQVPALVLVLVLVMVQVPAVIPAQEAVAPVLAVVPTQGAMVPVPAVVLDLMVMVRVRVVVLGQLAV